MGHINQRLYPKRVKLDTKARDAAVADLAQEIDVWKVEIPPFFVPDSAPTQSFEDPFHIVPEIFTRYVCPPSRTHV
jgi:hypothetical protein